MQGLVAQRIARPASDCPKLIAVWSLFARRDREVAGSGFFFNRKEDWLPKNPVEPVFFFLIVL